MNKDKRKIKKSLSENNISDITVINCIPKRLYSPKEVFKMIDFYYHPYCPVCKRKNKGGRIFMALDMMFCSDFCREMVCNTINYQKISERRYFHKFEDK